MGSETGVAELEESRILEKGRLGPGQMLAVDLENGRLLHNWDVKQEVASRHPYGAWLAEHRRNLAAQPWLQERQLGELELLQHQTAFGFTAEDLELVIEEMAGAGKEPTYCMGDDIPWRCSRTSPICSTTTSNSASPRSPIRRSTRCAKSW